MQFDFLAWMKRSTVLVFLTFLSYSAYRLIEANEIDLTLFKQLVPAAFYALFVIQMLYYFAWYNHERRKKAGDSDETVVAYQRLKQEIKVLALVQGMTFIVLYLGTTVVIAR
jgi:hypothetical protein